MSVLYYLEFSNNWFVLFSSLLFLMLDIFSFLTADSLRVARVAKVSDRVSVAAPREVLLSKNLKTIEASSR